MNQGIWLRVATIAVWAVAGVVIVVLLAARGTLPDIPPVAPAPGLRPVVYEFSTDT